MRGSIGAIEMATERSESPLAGTVSRRYSYTTVLASQGAVMNFFEAVSSGFRNYVNFSGRAVRSEYWYWALFSTIVNAVFGAIDQLLYPGAQIGAFSVAATGSGSLALTLPGLAVSVRRLHDIDRTGWWVLLWFAQSSAPLY